MAKDWNFHVAYKYWKGYSYEIILPVELVKENAIVLTYDDLEEMQ